MLLVFLGIFCGYRIFTTSSAFVEVAFLNVGQGDAFLLSHGSHQILIDTGKDGRALLTELGKRMAPWDRTIDAVLLTHSDEDHVGALPDLLDRYRVSLILSEEFSENTPLQEMLRAALTRHSVRRAAPRAGLSLKFGTVAQLEVVFPEEKFVAENEGRKETNETSVVARFRVHEDTFLFTGDLPKEELYLPEKAKEDIRVLKVAHHGSRFSTSALFLDRIKPEEAILSVGKNSYGHPSEEVVGRLHERGIRILRTDQQGTIVYRCPLLGERGCEYIDSYL